MRRRYLLKQAPGYYADFQGGFPRIPRLTPQHLGGSKTSADGVRRPCLLKQAAGYQTQARNERANNKIAVLKRLLELYPDKLQNNFVVATEKTVRIIE